MKRKLLWCELSVDVHSLSLLMAWWSNFGTSDNLRYLEDIRGCGTIWDDGEGGEKEGISARGRKY